MAGLMIFDHDQINVQKGIVEFNGFEKLKQEALQLSEQIQQVEVTDENIQSSKKLLAAVNKRVKEMEDRRISIKKEMLEPYNEFERQVKEIVNIVKDADNLVREQVRGLEEQERMEKREKIKEIFDKRIKQYTFSEVFTFDHFITPKHLNKSSSIKSVESEMVDLLEKKESDMKVIDNLPNRHDVLMEYIDTKDLSVAINIVNDREAWKKQISTKVPDKQEKKEVFLISIS